MHSSKRQSLTHEPIERKHCVLEHNGITYMIWMNSTYVNLTVLNVDEIPKLDIFKNLRVLVLPKSTKGEDIPKSLLKCEHLHILDLTKTSISSDELPRFLRLIPNLRINLMAVNLQSEELDFPLLTDDILNNLRDDIKSSVKTLMLINRFRNIRELPMEMVECIIKHMFDADETKTSTDKCIICLNLLDTVCIACESLVMIDNETCPTMSPPCKYNHKFHKHCIERWLKTRKHCPLDHDPIL